MFQARRLLALPFRQKIVQDTLKEDKDFRTDSHANIFFSLGMKGKYVGSKDAVPIISTIHMAND